MRLELTQIQHCPLCYKEAGFQKVYSLRDFDVVRCECGLEFITPSLDEKGQIEIYQSSEHLSRIDPRLEHYYEYESLNPGSKTFQEYEEALGRLSNLSSGRSLLEVGCGRGAFLKVAQKRGWKVLGVDSGAQNIQALRQNGIHGVCLNFLDYESKEKVDVVVFGDLIEHLRDPGLFLAKARKLLRPGGLVLIATPQYPNLMTCLASCVYRLSFGKMKGLLEKLYFLEHTSYFNKQTLRQLLKRSGFCEAQSWKTETDLERYRLHLGLKVILRFLFMIARIFYLQNRVIMIGRML